MSRGYGITGAGRNKYSLEGLILNEGCSGIHEHMAIPPSCIYQSISSLIWLNYGAISICRLKLVSY